MEKTESNLQCAGKSSSFATGNEWLDDVVYSPSISCESNEAVEKLGTCKQMNSWKTSVANDVKDSDVVHHTGDRIGSRVSREGEARVVENWSYFHCLPEEIHLKIFSYFTVEELCSTISPICSQWYRLAHDPSLWQKMTFISDDLTPTSVVFSLLCQAPLLKELSLQSRDDADAILYKVGELCPQLQSLSVRFSDGLNEKVVAFLADKCLDLQRLNVEGSRLMGDNCCRLISQFKNLKRLNLSHCLSLDGPSLLAIARSCVYLEDLNVDGIPRIWDQEMRAVIQERKGELNKLILDGEDLTDLTFSTLKQCQQLVVLGISFADLMTDEGLLKGVGALSTLHWLKIKRGLELSAGALATLFSSACTVRMLIHLDLSECSNLNDACVQNVAANCPLLTYLALCWCWDVTDKGIEYVIRGCGMLHVLDLIGVMRITGACFDLIPTHLPYLEYLDLEQCGNIVDSILEQVVLKQPKLKVIDYYGDQVVPDQKKMLDETESAFTLESGSDDDMPLKLKVYFLRNGF